jgi:histidine ammonia-lyase
VKAFINRALIEVNCNLPLDSGTYWTVINITLVNLHLIIVLIAHDNSLEIAESHRNCGQVQDSYTLRCMPQVHGVAIDTIAFVKRILTTGIVLDCCTIVVMYYYVEMNSATDNPMVFAETSKILSGGNFHGEYPAKALDYLAIGVHELSR